MSLSLESVFLIVLEFTLYVDQAGWSRNLPPECWDYRHGVCVWGFKTRFLCVTALVVLELLLETRLAKNSQTTCLPPTVQLWVAVHLPLLGLPPPGLTAPFFLKDWLVFFSRRLLCLVFAIKLLYKEFFPCVSNILKLHTFWI